MSEAANADSSGLWAQHQRWNCIDCGILRRPRSKDERTCSWDYDTHAHVGSVVEYRCCLCLAHRCDCEMPAAAFSAATSGLPKVPGCPQCLARWALLKAFEDELSCDMDRGKDPDKFLAKVRLTRQTIGAALQFRMDLIVVNVLLETSVGIVALQELARNRAFRSVCSDGGTSVCLWSTNGKLDLGVSVKARWAALHEGRLPVRGSRTTISPRLRMRRIKDAAGLTALVLDGNLVMLDVSGNNNLEELPVGGLARIITIRSIDCSGCPRLVSPPSEISNQSGTAVVTYIKHAQTDSIRSTSLDLVFVGSSESGKTSLKEALMYETGHASRTFPNARSQTVGMHFEEWDLRDWICVPLTQNTIVEDICRRYNTSLEAFKKQNQDIPSVLNEDRLGLLGKIELKGGRGKIGPWAYPLVRVRSGLSFQVKDMTGQDICVVPNQIFLGKRAIYVLVWKAVRGLVENTMEDEKEIDATISTCMDFIQTRVPGARFVLAVTHTDCVQSWELQRQMKRVRELVLRKLKSFCVDNSDENFILPLEVDCDGESFPVNCLNGEGVYALRSRLKLLAEQSPWWRESIPTNFVEFQQAISKKAIDEGLTWISWQYYEDLGRKMGLQANLLKICTKFLNDLASIKYFGTYEDLPRTDLIDCTVFINPNWMINAFRGLICHDRESLFTYFGSVATWKQFGLKDNSSNLERLTEAQRVKWIRRVKNLACYGILHRELVYFLWPNGIWQHSNPQVADLSLHFWEWLREKQKEGNIWQNDMCKVENDYMRVLALLQCTDIVHPISEIEFVAPILLAESRHNKIDARALAAGDCEFMQNFYFTSMPVGLFERLIIKNLSVYDHVDFSQAVATFYARGLKVHTFLTEDVEIKSQVGVRNAVRIQCFASTQQQMEVIRRQIDELRAFFPGMRQLHDDTAPPERRDSSQVEAPIQVWIIEATPAFEVTIVLNKERCESTDKSPNVHLKSIGENMVTYNVDCIPGVIAETFEGQGIDADDVKVIDIQELNTTVRLKIRIDKLKHRQEHVGTLLNAFKREGFDIMVLQTWKGVADQLKTMLLDVDNEQRPEDLEALNIHTGQEEDLDPRQLRLAVVCMDDTTTKDPACVKLFEKAIEAKVAIIPLICPTYEFPKKVRGEKVTNESEFGEWWPENMWQMRHHALSVNFQRLTEWRSKVRDEVYPRVIKHLSAWRGLAPDPQRFQKFNDHIICVQCHDEVRQPPGFFPRERCEKIIADWKINLNLAHYDSDLTTINETADDHDPDRSDDEDAEVQMQEPTSPRITSATHQSTETRPTTHSSGTKREQGAKCPTAVEEPVEMCEFGHTLTVEEILSESRMYESFTCPQCVQVGRAPPFCFGRQECLMLLHEERTRARRDISITCASCSTAVRLLDIVVPEVFVSYHWGVHDEDTHTFSTQELAKSIQHRLEQDADVLTWFDVDGNSSQGQSALKRLEACILQSRVVIMFLSDAYCSSDMCVRQYLISVRHRKYIIPILVPEAGFVHGHSSGWSGAPQSQDPEWWMHCNHVSKNIDPDTGKKFSWNGLAQFTPIDLRVCFREFLSDWRFQVEACRSSATMMAAEKEIAKVCSHMHAHENLY